LRCPDLQPGDIWLLLSFADQYREDMYNKLGVKRDRLAPPMLQGQVCRHSVVLHAWHGQSPYYAMHRRLTT
jgi:hypothetical protein